MTGDTAEPGADPPSAPPVPPAPPSPELEVDFADGDGGADGPPEYVTYTELLDEWNAIVGSVYPDKICTRIPREYHHVIMTQIVEFHSPGATHEEALDVWQKDFRRILNAKFLLQQPWFNLYWYLSTDVEHRVWMFLGEYNNLWKRQQI